MQVFKITVMTVMVLLSGCDSSQAENEDSLQNNMRPNSSAPLTVVLSDMGNSFQETPSTLLIKQTVSGSSIESPDRATVTLEENTPTDDSVAAMRYSYQLSKSNDSWTIDSKDISQRCVSGRGSADFSNDLCR